MGTAGRQNNNHWKSLRKIYDRFIKIQGDPKKIALGFALGLFVGMSPSMGLQTPIAIFFAALLKWNKISSAIGVWITNPATAPFIYGLTYYVGSKIMGVQKTFNPPSHDLSTDTITRILGKAPEIIWVLVLGGAIVGLPVALAGYYFSYKAILKYQRDLKKKIEKRRERKEMKKRKKKRK